MWAGQDYWAGPVALPARPSGRPRSSALPRVAMRVGRGSLPGAFPCRCTRGSSVLVCHDGPGEASERGDHLRSGRAVPLRPRGVVRRLAIRTWHRHANCALTLAPMRQAMSCNTRSAHQHICSLAYECNVSQCLINQPSVAQSGLRGVCSRPRGIRMGEIRPTFRSPEMITLTGLKPGGRHADGRPATCAPDILLISGDRGRQVFQLGGLNFAPIDPPAAALSPNSPPPATPTGAAASCDTGDAGHPMGSPAQAISPLPRSPP
jgi:hypothetical protein